MDFQDGPALVLEKARAASLSPAPRELPRDLLGARQVTNAALPCEKIPFLSVRGPIRPGSDYACCPHAF